MKQGPVIEPWGSAMEKAGISSITKLARQADLSVETVRRIVNGTRANPSEETVRKIATALRIRASEAGQWVGLPLEDAEFPYSPPREASLLSHRQREAVDEVIRLFAAGNQNRERGRSSSQPDPAGQSPSEYDQAVQAKLARLAQSDYAPAAHPPLQDPYEGLGEESQEEW